MGDRSAGTVHGVDATDEFVAALERDDLPLDEAALWIAAHASPGLDVVGFLWELDAIAYDVEEPTLDALCQQLFAELGFRGNTEDYYDPANSFLDQVLHRRTGNPITLSVLTLSVGWRCGTPLDPIGMPGHFLLRDRNDPSRFVDAFNGGTELDVAGCRDLFARLAGPTAPFAMEFLHPTPPQLVLARMLNNLVASFQNLGDRASLGWAARLRSHIADVPAPGLDRIADQLGNAGRWDDAGLILANLADAETSEEAAEALEQRSISWLARLN